MSLKFPRAVRLTIGRRAAFLYLIAITRILAQEKWFSIQGRALVAGGDSAANAEVDLVCNGSVRRTAYTDTSGYFSLMGSEYGDVVHEWAAKVRSSDFMPGNCQLKLSLPRCRTTIIDLSRPDWPGSMNLGIVILNTLDRSPASTVDVADLKTWGPAERLYRKAGKARLAGKLVDAEKLISTVLQKFPDFAAAWIELGRIQIARGNADWARTAFAQAVALGGAKAPATEVETIPK